jgi:hypothetical protein
MTMYRHQILCLLLLLLAAFSNCRLAAADQTGNARRTIGRMDPIYPIALRHRARLQQQIAAGTETPEFSDRIDPQGPQESIEPELGMGKIFPAGIAVIYVHMSLQR